MKYIYILFVLAIPAFGQTAADFANMSAEYRALISERSKLSDQAKREQIYLFLEVVKPFIYPDSFPERFKEFGFSEKTLSHYEGWVNFSFSAYKELNDPLKDNKTSIEADKANGALLNNTLLVTGINAPQTQQKTLNQDIALFGKMGGYIRPYINSTIIKNTTAYLVEIKRFKKLYDRKYFTTLRNRNILEYFVDGAVQEMTCKRKKNNGLLVAPNKGAFILLSNPIFAVATTELRYEDFNFQVFTMLPVLGYDWFTSDFKHFYGASLFASAPIGNRKLISIENSYYGLEVHYDQLVNLGFGVNWDQENPNTDKKELGFKAFISAGLFTSYYKKKAGLD